MQSNVLYKNTLLYPSLTVINLLFFVIVMYSHALQRLINSAGVRISQEVVITHKGKKYEGVLMPSTELGDPDSLVIKLDNGYNVGLKYDPKMKLSKGGKEPKDVKEEYQYELGKRRKVISLKFDPKKAHVSLIATGGTVASRVEYKTGAVTPLMTTDEILALVPELQEIIYLKDILRPFTKWSEDMNYKDWQEIAKLSAKELNENEGVIIAHGTDILHYTAAALSFMLPDVSKPVVVTGSQRSSDRGSTDAAINLICSSYVAKSDMAEVGVCMHATMDDVYCYFLRGTKVRKMDKSRRDTFRPINALPLAKVWPSGKIEVMNKEHKKRSNREVKADTKFEPKVAFLKVYPGSDPEMMDYFISKGYKGFVLEGTGFGIIPTKAEKSWIPIVKKTVKDGIPVVVTSQAMYGRVHPNVYDSLRTIYYEAQAIPSEDMTPETAFIKLGWVLGHTSDLNEVRKMMLKNYAGEISSRILPETFLY